VSSGESEVKQKYVDTYLEAITKARYLEKLQIIGDKDPYDMKKAE
jgi:hypothetical protein